MNWKEHYKKMKPYFKLRQKEPIEGLQIDPSRAIIEAVIQRHVEWRFPGTNSNGRREATPWDLIYFKREPMSNIDWAECLLMDEFHFRVMIRLI